MSTAQPCILHMHRNFINNQIRILLEGNLEINKHISKTTQSSDLALTTTFDEWKIATTWPAWRLALGLTWQERANAIRQAEPPALSTLHLSFCFPLHSALIATSHSRFLGSSFSSINLTFSNFFHHFLEISRHLQHSGSYNIICLRSSILTFCFPR